MSRIAIIAMSLLVMGCSVTISSDYIDNNDAWIDNARGRYELGGGAYEYFRRDLSPYVSLAPLQDIWIASDGSFEIEDRYGDYIYFDLANREGDRFGTWAVYKFVYRSDSGRMTTKYAALALGETPGNIIIGDAYSEESSPQVINRGAVILRDR